MVRDTDRGNAAFDQGQGTLRRQVPWCTERICSVARYLGVVLGVLQKYGSISIDST